MQHRDVHYGRPKKIVLIAIPLALSGFTHIWNPIGFPAIHTDESHYMRRAVEVLNGLGPQESQSMHSVPFDHPYFGQLFLAGMLYLTGYPSSLNPSAHNFSEALNSVEMLYIVPRVLMGLLAIADTFLIYKITEKRYNNWTIAFMAATLFAVMPMGWMTRRILLDSILLPFVLSSILFALYAMGVSIRSNDSYVRDLEKSSHTKKNVSKNIGLILVSGTFLGVALFTKIPAITMIPIAGSIVLFANGDAMKLVGSRKNIRNWFIQKRLKSLVIWFIPVIGIPLIWPSYALYLGDLNEWVDGMLWQSIGRAERSGISSVYDAFRIDQILLVLGIVGVVYSALRKDFFTLIWVAPFFIFISFVGWTVHFHYILVLPAFCIAASTLVGDISSWVTRRMDRRKKILLPFAIISTITSFGLLTTAILITTDVNFSFFRGYAYVLQALDGDRVSTLASENITMIGRPWISSYFWIPKFVFDFQSISNLHDTQVTAPPYEVMTRKVIFIIDNVGPNILDDDDEFPRQTRALYNDSQTLANIDNTQYDFEEYPYSGAKGVSTGKGKIVVRANF